MANENGDRDDWLYTPAGTYALAWRWRIEQMSARLNYARLDEKISKTFSCSWENYVVVVLGVVARMVPIVYLYALLDSNAISKAPGLTLFIIVILVIWLVPVIYYTFLILGDFDPEKKPGWGERIFGGFYDIHYTQYCKWALRAFIIKLYEDRFSFLSAHPPRYVPQVKYNEMCGNDSYWYDKTTDAHYAKGEGPAVAFGDLADGEKFWYDEVSEKYYRGEDPRKHPALDKYYSEHNPFDHFNLGEMRYAHQFKKDFFHDEMEKIERFYKGLNRPVSAFDVHFTNSLIRRKKS